MLLAATMCAGAFVSAPSLAHERVSAASVVSPVVIARPVAAIGTGRATPPRPAPSTGVDLVGVSVGSGPLVVLDAPAAVTLTRTSRDSFVASVHVRVVDARGSNTGWKFSLSVGDDATTTIARVRSVVADAPTVVGISAVAVAPVRSDGPTTLVRAAAGSGSGAYDVTINVEQRATDTDGRMQRRVPVRFAIT